MITNRADIILLTAMVAVLVPLRMAKSEAAVSGAGPAISTPSPSDVDAASSRLLAAAEPFEALTETAFSGLGLGLDSAIAAADRAAQSSRDLLPAASEAQLVGRLAEIHAARKTDDRAGMAISSVEAYRILVSAAHPSQVPTAVNLMDYAGFRYDADFRAKPVRWSDMKEAAAFARDQWSSISHEVAITSLKQRIDAALNDMAAGAAQTNTFKARRSVTAELGLVDELEKYFSKR
jgi:hypothetical protein